MPDKPHKDRVKFDTSPVIRRALRLRAALDDIDLQDVINAALREYLKEQVEEVVRRGLVQPPAAAEPAKPGGTRKRSRPE